MTIVAERQAAADARYQAQVQALQSAELVETKVVQFGDRSLTVNAVKPLQLTKPVREQRAEAVNPFTEEEFKALLAEHEQQSKPQEQISMAATVYENAYSEITWRDTESRAEFTVWTNVSLNYLRPISTLEDGNYGYLYFGFVTNITHEEEAIRLELARQHGFPDIESRWKTPPIAFSSDQFEYVVIADDPAQVPQKLYRQLDAVLGHYLANREELEVMHHNTQTLEKARQAYLEAHPPSPKPTMINFWTIDTEAATN